MTAIERNTAKLMQQKLQAKLDKLFAEQQMLNGNKGGSTFKRGGLVHANNGWYEDPTEFFNGRPGTYNSKTMPYMTGDVNVYGQRTIKPGTTPGYPVSLPNVDVTGQGFTQPGTTAGNPYQLGDVNVSSTQTGNQANPQQPYRSLSGGQPQQNITREQYTGTPDFSTPEQAGFGNNQTRVQAINQVLPKGNSVGKPTGLINAGATGAYKPYLNPANNFDFTHLIPKNVNENGLINAGATGAYKPYLNPANNFDFTQLIPKNVNENGMVAPNNFDFTHLIPKNVNENGMVAPPPGGPFDFTQLIPKNVNENGMVAPPPGGPMDQNFTATEAPKSTGPNWGKIGTFAGQIAPIAYNMFKGLQRPDKVKPMYNPYEGQIRSAMANRRFNIDPLLNANMVANAVGNRNIRNAANSRGEMMGNYGASQNARMTSDAAAWAQKSNMDNQYLGEQAQMDANLGANRAQMDWTAQDYNMQNKAMTNKFMGNAFRDLGMFSQNLQLLGNQMKNDDMRRGIYKDQFGNSPVGGFMPNIMDIANAFAYLNKNKNGQ